MSWLVFVVRSIGGMRIGLLLRRVHLRRVRRVLIRLRHLLISLGMIRNRRLRRLLMRDIRIRRLRRRRFSGFV